MSDRLPDLWDANQSLTQQHDSRVEAYLDRVLLPLYRRMPASECREVRMEMCAHLEALIAAYEELGSDHDDAVADALRRFGDERALHMEWSAVGLRELLRRPLPTVIAAGAVGMSTMAACGALFLGTVMSGESPLAMLLAGPLFPMAAGVLLWLGRRPGRKRFTPLLLGALAMVPVAVELPGAASPFFLSEILMRLDLCFVAAAGTCALGILSAAWRQRQTPRAREAGA